MWLLGLGWRKLSQRNWGEVVENVAGTGEYHWMAGNFLYVRPLQWSDLPVDAHELIALCAPRPVFIGGGATPGRRHAMTSAESLLPIRLCAGKIERG
jgi:hypothetical protein